MTWWSDRLPADRCDRPGRRARAAGRGEQARSRGRGRPAGSAGSREALLHAARIEFAERSFEQVSVRAIAERAGVDAAMVNHWFGGKQGLFADAAELAVGVDDIVQCVASGPRERAGERLLRAFLAVCDRNPEQMAILVRNMHSNELAERALRSLVEDLVLRPVIVALGVDESRLRTALCSLQLIGLAVARCARRPDSQIQVGVGDLVAAMAPTLQRYLDGEVRSTGGPA